MERGQTKRLLAILVTWVIVLLIVMWLVREPAQTPTPIVQVPPTMAAHQTPQPPAATAKEADTPSKEDPAEASEKQPPAPGELSGPPSHDIFASMAPKSKPRTPSRPQASTYPMTPVPQPNLPPFNFNTNTTPTPAKALQPAQKPVKVKLLGIANSGLESACLLQVGESTLYLKSGDVVQTNTGELRIISVRPTKVRLITPQGPLTLTTPGAQVSIEAKRPVALTHRLDNTPSPASSQAGSGQVALKPVAEPPDIYVVQPGDTLYSISRRYFGSPRYVRTLAKMNHLRNPSVIYVGQRLVLRSGARPVAAGRSWLQTAPRVASPRQQVSAPAIRKGEVKLYKVQPGDTLYKISRRFYGNITGAKKLARSNGIKNPNLIHPNMVLRIEL